MGAYIYSVLCAALTVCVICTLAPEKEGLAKYIAFAGALAVALCILHPFSGSTELPGIDGLFEAEDSTTSDSRAAAEYAARSAIMSFCAMSGADAADVSAEVEISENGTSVWLRCGNAVGNADELEARLSEILGFDITVCEGDA